MQPAWPPAADGDGRSRVPNHAGPFLLRTRILRAAANSASAHAERPITGPGDELRGDQPRLLCPAAFGFSLFAEVAFAGSFFARVGCLAFAFRGGLGLG